MNLNFAHFLTYLNRSRNTFFNLIRNLLRFIIKCEMYKTIRGYLAILFRTDTWELGFIFTLGK